MDIQFYINHTTHIKLTGWTLLKDNLKKQFFQISKLFFQISKIYWIFWCKYEKMYANDIILSKAMMK